MIVNRPIHPHFQCFLDFKSNALTKLYLDLRDYVLSQHPTSNELIYNTHALVSVYSLSDRLSEAYCMIPIYTNHLNLGFHKGTILNDPNGLLQGTGKLIRHIPINLKTDYRNKAVEHLIFQAVQLASEEMDQKRKKNGLTISKIKLK